VGRIVPDRKAPPRLNSFSPASAGFFLPDESNWYFYLDDIDTVWYLSFNNATHEPNRTAARWPGAKGEGVGGLGQSAPGSAEGISAR